MKQLLCLLALFVLSAPTTAAEGATMGYVDLDKVLKESDMGREATAELEKKFGGDQKSIADEEQAIRQLQQTLRRDQALMSQAELDKRTAEGQQRVMELQKKAAALQKAVAADQSGMLEEILALTQGVASELAKEKKLSAIFERTRSGLLYIEDSLNLTDEIIKRLNAQKKK